ncbi:MAG: co-chaperone GroES family protein [Pseudohongiellaceae bacterium]
MPEANEAPNTDELKARFDAMTERENNDNGITLGAQREKEAIEKAQKVYAAARDLVANGMIKAAGYRVLVKPLEGTMGLEQAEADLFPELAGRGAVIKTHNELEREERGEHFGIVLNIGPIAFDRLGGRGSWCDEGDTVVFSRYAGTRVEHPPGSGNFYQLMNDEDIFGVIK